MEIQTYKAIREAVGDMLLQGLSMKFKNEAHENEELSKILQEKFDSAGLIVRHAPNGVDLRCPITNRPYFCDMELDGEMVPTYGGPFDSYTVPEKDEDGFYFVHRYDHDRGCWVEDENL